MTTNPILPRIKFCGEKLLELLKQAGSTVFLSQNLMTRGITTDFTDFSILFYSADITSERDRYESMRLLGRIHFSNFIALSAPEWKILEFMTIP